MIEPLDLMKVEFKKTILASYSLSSLNLTTTHAKIDNSDGWNELEAVNKDTFLEEWIGNSRFILINIEKRGNCLLN